MITEKKCTLCGEVKPVTDFHRRRDRPGGNGYVARCKECLREPVRQRAAKWWAEKGHLQNARRRDERKADPEGVRARDRARERRRRKTPQWQAYQSKWRSENPESVAEIMRRYRQKFPRWTGHDDDPETVAYVAILLSDPCGICGARPVEIDHIDPVALGGTSDWTNLGALCRTCNASKNARPLMVALAEGIATQE